MILNKLQQFAYNSILQQKNIFLTGGGGVGKSEIIKYFYQQHSHSIKTAVTSTTGASALLIKGTTLHSYLGIGLGNDTVNTLIKKIRKRTPIRKRWQELQVLIIDEVSMLNPDLFDKLNEIAKIIRRIDRPFGGIQLILSGDFCQLPCVDSHQFCFEADAWSECQFETIQLTEIIRQKDTNFQECLNEIRFGNVSESTKKLLSTRINKKLKNDLGIKPTRLYSHNYKVDEINSKKLEKLIAKTGEVNQYNIEINIKKKKANIDKIIKNCPAISELQLTTGCQVMLIYNLDSESGLVNGSRGVVTGFVQDLPIVKFLNGEERILDYHEWEIEENEIKIASIHQIPLKLGYAFSIHKSQGCTLDYVIVDLSKIFDYGMAYVALSRVKNLEGLSIKKNINWLQIKAHPKALEFYQNL